MGNMHGLLFFLQWCNSVFRGGGTYASNRDICGPARGPMVGAGGRHPLLPWGFRGIQNLDSIVFGGFISKNYIIGLYKWGGGQFLLRPPYPKKVGGRIPSVPPQGVAPM